MPDDGSVDESRYQGLAYDEAADLAAGEGWHVRKREPGGVYTMEYRPDRLNLDVDDAGVVVHASVG